MYAQWNNWNEAEGEPRVMFDDGSRPVPLVSVSREHKAQEVSIKHVRNYGTGIVVLQRLPAAW